jgi:hypothetical protein
MSRFYGTCLVAIVPLLAFIALRPIATPQPASAAERYQYRVVPTGIDGAQIQAELNARAADGWELAAPVTREGVNGVDLILRKPAQ